MIYTHFLEKIGKIFGEYIPKYIQCIYRHRFISVVCTLTKCPCRTLVLFSVLATLIQWFKAWLCTLNDINMSYTCGYTCHVLAPSCKILVIPKGIEP